MAMIKAKAEITIFNVKDVKSVTRYYLLQSSTVTAPAKPTTINPGGNWKTTEPSYTDGSTNTLYFVDLTIMSDGKTFSYSDVSKSSSYEAAKSAWNKANNAQKTADDIADNIYYPDTVEVDGSKLRAGTVTAKQINVADLFAQDIQASGSISGMTINAKKGQIGTWSISVEGLSRSFGVVSNIYGAMIKQVLRNYELKIGADQTPKQKDASFFMASASDEIEIGSGAHKPILARYVINLLGEQYTYGEYDSVEKNGTTINYPKTHISNTIKGMSAYENTVDDNGNVQSEEKVNINANNSKFSGITNNGTIDSTDNISTSGNFYCKGNLIGETIIGIKENVSIKKAAWVNTGASITLPPGTYMMVGTINFGSCKAGRLGARFATGGVSYGQMTNLIPGLSTNAAPTSVQVQWIMNVTDTTKYDLQAFQSSTAAVSCSSWIKAVRIA